MGEKLIFPNFATDFFINRKKKKFPKKESQIFFCFEGFNDIRSPAQVFLLTIVEKHRNLRGDVNNSY